MANLIGLIHSDQHIRRSAERLGTALASVQEYAEPALARAVQAEKNLYAAIDAEFGLLSATEAGRRLGSRSSAPRNLAASARRAGRLLSIRWGAQQLYPAFQFDQEGRALEVIARLIDLGVELDRTETGIVQWLMGPTTYLDGRRPVDLIDSDPDLLLETARRAWGVSW